MKRIAFCIVVLLFVPFTAQADFTFFMKNGSEISAIKTYAEKGDEVTAYFSTGSMIIPKQDILRIEGSESTEESVAPEAEPGTQQQQEKRGEKTGRPQESGQMDERKNALNNELDSLRTEIREVEKREMDLVTTINEKIGTDKSYNIIQRKQMEKEVEPLKSELTDVQQKKMELINKRSALEDQLRQTQ